jgi:hypothetical protein
MTNRFLISVAALGLIAGTGFANAQGTGAAREGGAAGGAAVQQTAPGSERAAPSAAPMNKDAGEAKGMKSTQSEPKASEPKAPAAGKNQRAEDNMQGEKSKSMSSETHDKGAAGKDMKADSKGTADSKSQTTTQSQTSPTNQKGMNAETKGTVDSKSTTTTGNAATSATAAPPAEKRTQIVHRGLGAPFASKQRVRGGQKCPPLSRLPMPRPPPWCPVAASSGIG